MRKKLLKVISITLATAILLTTSAFAATADKSQATLVSAEIASKTSNIKSGEGTTNDVNRLLKLAKEGNVEAATAIKSFDCFNEDIVDKALQNIKVEPNTEKTISFDDGSSIELKNVTTSTNISLMGMPAMATLMSTYPTSPQTTYIYETHSVLGIAVYIHGGSATWQDNSRTVCHIISTAPYVSGTLMTITNTSSSILTNNVQDSYFNVSASISYVQYGISLWSKSGTDIMYVDTAGAAGFSSKGLCN